MRRLATFLPGILPAVLAVVLIGHFGMTLAYLTPFNPIKMRFFSTIYAYMHPLFSQDWHLFAPDPIRDSRVLTISCRLRQATGETIDTAWADISTPRLEEHYRNRFAPADRLDRPTSNAMQQLFETNELTILLDKHRPPDNPEYNKTVDELTKADEQGREHSRNMMNRIASAHCDQLYGYGRTEAVRTRIVFLQFPRFSKRHMPDSAGEFSEVILDWAPYQAVAPLMSEEASE